MYFIFFFLLNINLSLFLCFTIIVFLILHVSFLHLIILFYCYFQNNNLIVIADDILAQKIVVRLKVLNVKYPTAYLYAPYVIEIGTEQNWMSGCRLCNFMSYRHWQCAIRKTSVQANNLDCFLLF